MNRTLNLNVDNLNLSGKIVAVAVSGGKDSVCLLDYLTKNSEKSGIKVKAINVEHGIRGEDSIKDSEFVRSLCNRLGVELFFKKVDSLTYSRLNGTSIEESARILRYGVFNEAIDSGFCDVVATAHHLSDNAETVLFNILRGASIGGVGGIDELSENGRIIRPLINVRKEEIDEYVKENNLEFVTDKTNFDDEYTRNFLRLKVIPLIKEKFPRAEDALCRLSEISEKEDAFLNESARNVLIFAGDEISVPISVPEVIFARAAILAMKELGIVKDYEKRHIDGLLSLIGLKNGSEMSLPKGVKAVKDYDKITFYKDKEKSIETAPFKVGRTELNGITIVVEPCSEMESGSGAKYFDGDKIPSGSVFRARADGDVFEKFGGKTKKLKSYLIDKKIPARKRDELVVLADGKNVLLVCEIEISERIKVDNGTKNMLKCYKG